MRWGKSGKLPFMRTETARHHMIYNQIRTWDVVDKTVLATLASVARERFVPAEYRELAFADVALPLPCGQTLLKPMVEGRLLLHLDVRASDRALVIGTGSGFMTACIAKRADRVTSIDIHRQLVDEAAVKLADEQIYNVDVLTADFNAYHPTQTYDRILVAGSMPLFDARLPEWLKPDGKLLLIVGQAPTMTVELVERHENSYSRRALFETVVQKLVNVPEPPPFVF
jgi:protein-L-isoaspartate(D-aspartate) O-methyltransferase